MQRVLFIVTVFVVITTFYVARCELFPIPQNQYAMPRDKQFVVLQCNSTLGHRITWLIKKPGSSSRCEIYNGYNFVENVQNVSSYCKVDNGPHGKYELNVKATKEAAQRYICLEPGSLIEASAEVIIIESHPECNVTSYYESFIFICHLRFRGNWGPVMEWRNGISGEVISENVYNNSVPSESLTSRLIVPVNQSRDSKLYFTCTTNFRIQEKPSETTADNIPSYSYKWVSPEYIAAHEPAGRTPKPVFATFILVPIIVGLLVLAFCWANKRYSMQLKCRKDRQNVQEEETFTKSQKSVMLRMIS